MPDLLHLNEKGTPSGQNPSSKAEGIDGRIGQLKTNALPQGECLNEGEKLPV